MTYIALQIACCIERARLESGANGWPEPDDEIYWHTREVAPEFSRKLGIPYTKVVAAVKETLNLTKSIIYQYSEPFWPELAHPDLIIKEVMRS